MWDGFEENHFCIYHMKAVTCSSRFCDSVPHFNSRGWQIRGMPMLGWSDIPVYQFCCCRPKELYFIKVSCSCHFCWFAFSSRFCMNALFCFFQVEQLHKIFKLCGSPPDEYWKKSKLPHATLFKPQQPYDSCLRETLKDLPTTAVNLIKTLLSVEPYKRGTASSALASEVIITSYSIWYARFKRWPWFI